jgi:hypothetical protein
MTGLAQLSPRLVSKEAICDYLGAISPATYDKWAARGLVPGPVPGTNRYDLRQHDFVLDAKLGLNAMGRKLSPLEEWERGHE